MQQTLRLGQVAQPSVLAQVAAAVKSLGESKKQLVAWVKAHREQLECYVGGPVIVAFCFALYYVASVLEGGAL